MTILLNRVKQLIQRPGNPAMMDKQRRDKLMDELLTLTRAQRDENRRLKSSVRFWRAACALCYICWIASELAFLYLYGRW